MSAQTPPVENKTTATTNTGASSSNGVSTKPLLAPNEAPSKQQPAAKPVPPRSREGLKAVRARFNRDQFVKKKKKKEGEGNGTDSATSASGTGGPLVVALKTTSGRGSSAIDAALNPGTMELADPEAVAKFFSFDPNTMWLEKKPGQVVIGALAAGQAYLVRGERQRKATGGTDDWQAQEEGSNKDMTRGGRRVLVAYDSRMAAHEPPMSRHPEQPARITRAWDALVAAFGLPAPPEAEVLSRGSKNVTPSEEVRAVGTEKKIRDKSCGDASDEARDAVVPPLQERQQEPSANVTPSVIFANCLVQLPARLATADEVVLVHPPGFVERVFSRDNFDECLDEGTYFSGQASRTATLLSCGLVIDAVLRAAGCPADENSASTKDKEQLTTAAAAGVARNGFCLVRPPGHHCGESQHRGFCIVNNVAVAVRRFQQSVMARDGTTRRPKVAVVDFDVHHGDGTEEIFYSDPSVLVLSMHRYDDGKFYPYTGHPGRVGEGEGAGFNFNIAFDTTPGSVRTITDTVFDLCLESLILPLLHSFEPELIMVSAGFDAAVGDPLGRMDVVNGFGILTAALLKFATDHSRPAPLDGTDGEACATVGSSPHRQLPVVMVLEGGYNLQSVSDGVVSCVSALASGGPGGSAVIPNTVRCADDVATHIGWACYNVLRTVNAHCAASQPPSHPFARTLQRATDRLMYDGLLGEEADTRRQLEAVWRSEQPSVPNVANIGIG